MRTLEAQGVDTIFGIPGVHNLAIYDALLDAGIRHIVARHEQGAAFMADGYARASGRIGACLCTSGPALLNAATSLGTAYCDSSPLLCIASQIPAAAIGKEKGFIHECRDQLGCLRPVVSWCERADSVSAIPAVLGEAFARMRDGRPRPAAVEIPCDVLDGSGTACIPPAAMPRAPAPAAPDLDAAVQALRQSKRPVIWAGGGLISSGGSAALGLLHHVDEDRDLALALLDRALQRNDLPPPASDRLSLAGCAGSSPAAPRTACARRGGG